MMKKILQWFFPLLGFCTLLFVWSVSIRTNGGLQATFTSGDPTVTTYNIFRLFGLTAFTLVSFQILTGPYMKFWERLYGPNFYRFHAFEGIFALIFALLHPTLLYIHLAYIHTSVFNFAKNFPIQYYFGPIALLLLITTVSTAIFAVLKKSGFKKSWHWIHLLNYVVFVLVFFHSRTIGTDVAASTSPLRILWNVFFVGMIIGLLYRRVYRPMREKDSGLSS